MSESCTTAKPTLHVELKEREREEITEVVLTSALNEMRTFSTRIASKLNHKVEGVGKLLLNKKAVVRVFVYPSYD